MRPALIIRPVHAGDAPALQALADLLDTVNLPDDPAAIASLIADSERSFAGNGGRHASYTLVAERAGRLLGTGSLFAFHGMPDEPHYYLRVVDQVVHSTQLNADRTRRVLKLGKDVEPWSEFGGLVVHPEARGQGVGRLLVAARLLLVAMHPDRFCRRLLAELLPPRREDGGNAFWDAVGKPLTGLDYYRADLLCRSDKEFIDAFFPHEELTADLLPAAAQALIGQEGPATAPVRSLLRRAGFRYLGTIDPFDAGPHDGADVKDVAPIQRSRRLVRLDLPPLTTREATRDMAPSAGAGAAAGDAPSATANAAPATADAASTTAGAAAGEDAGDQDGLVEHLIGTPDHRFIAAPCAVAGDGLRLWHDLSALIGVKAGDPCWAMPLDW